tara:strand:- start:231 stop:437 length:207 start_codon:yes stop_codon:yes gene_type:complete
MKSYLKPKPNSWMSADQWGEEVRRQKQRETRTDYRLQIDELSYSKYSEEYEKDYLLWGEKPNDTTSKN